MGHDCGLYQIVTIFESILRHRESFYKDIEHQLYQNHFELISFYLGNLH